MLLNCLLICVLAFEGITVCGSTSIHVCVRERGTEDDFVSAHSECVGCVRECVCVTKQKRGLIRRPEGLEPR